MQKGLVCSWICKYLRQCKGQKDAEQESSFDRSENKRVATRSKSCLRLNHQSSSSDSATFCSLKESSKCSQALSVPNVSESLSNQTSCREVHDEHDEDDATTIYDTVGLNSIFGLMIDTILIFHFFSHIEWAFSGPFCHRN